MSKRPGISPQDFEEELKRMAGINAVIAERFSIQDQILNILQGKGEKKFGSIAEKIRDMQERAGVLEMNNVKRAQRKEEHIDESNIKLLKIFPRIKDTVLKFIETNPHPDEYSLAKKIRNAVHALIQSQGIKENADQLIADTDFKKWLHSKCVSVDQSNADDEIYLDHNTEITEDDRRANNDLMSQTEPATIR
jgi:hypothetical protein